MSSDIIVRIIPFIVNQIIYIYYLFLRKKNGYSLICNTIAMSLKIPKYVVLK